MPSAHHKGNQPAGSIEIRLGTAHVVLLPQRAAWLPTSRTLLIADTHWGKSQLFRRAGAPIPAGTTAEQLARMSALLDLTNAVSILVLGDLIHAPAGVTDDLVGSVAAWTAQTRESRRAQARPEVHLGLVPGNHDARLGLARLTEFVDSIGFCLHEGEIELEGLRLRHIDDLSDPTETGKPLVAGHVHPAITIGSGEFPTKVPAFWQPRPGVLILPAFSPFTGGVPIAPSQWGSGVYPAAEGRVVPLGVPGISPVVS